MGKLRFDILCITWGDQHTNLFLDIVLPSYLSLNNLPKVCQFHRVVLSIYTTRKDKEKIISHPNYQKIKTFIECEIFMVDEILSSRERNKYAIKGAILALGLEKVQKLQSVALFFPPDCLIADGGIYRFCSLIEQGKQAVLTGALARVEMESSYPELMKYYDPATCTLTIDSQRLVDLGFQYLHEIGRNFFWHGNMFTRWPSIIYWQAGKKSILGKFFHWHPVAVNFKGINKRLPKTLMAEDDGLIEFLEISPDKVYNVTHSEEAMCIEISSKFMDIGASFSIASRKKKISLLKFICFITTISDRKKFLNYNVKFQGSEVVEWDKNERKILADLTFFSYLIKFLNLPLVSSFIFPVVNLKFFARKLGAGFFKRKIIKSFIWIKEKSVLRSKKVLR